MEVVLDNFYVDDGVGYRLQFGQIVGKSNTVISDSQLNYFKDRAFSAHDRDQDTWKSTNCASANKGGWWFRSCNHICLNCDQKNYRFGGMWGKRGKVPLTETKMSIRIKT